MTERFLARTATALPDQAILKGGYALELRLQQARTTQDLDLAIRGLPANEVVEALRDAAEIDPPLRPQRSRWRCTSRTSSTPSRFRDPKGASTPRLRTSST